MVSLNEVVDRAYREGYAVPAFNFWTYEDAQAIVRGAEELSSPVILMASMSCLKHLGECFVVDMVESIAKKTSIPLVLHLDHAEDIDIVLHAMRNGFTSVMYDGSKLPIEENIKNTQFVVRAGKALGVSIEAEIGRVGRGEEGESITEILTEPEGALMFFSETCVDALAIAVGTCHGMQKQEAAIHFEIVEGISALVDVPLVLHGSSGVKNEDLVRIARTGISKINFGTRLRRAFVERCLSILKEDPGIRNHLTLIENSSVAITKTVEEKIGFLGCSGKV